MTRTLSTFIISLLLIGVPCQSLADNLLEEYAAAQLYELRNSYPEDALRYIGVVVMDVATGDVLADVSLFENNNVSVPSGIGRSLLYLAMMPETNPFMVLDTGNGRYFDSMGCCVDDFNRSRGGFGSIQLKASFCLNSDIGILKAAEQSFENKMSLLITALDRTGIDRTFCSYGSMWSSHELLGHHSFLSLTQQVRWCNSVACGKGEGWDSLRSAMRKTVTDGLGTRMNSAYTSVAGMTNVSQEDADGCKGSFAAAFFPYYHQPKYTVGVYILGRQSGVASSSSIVRKVVDWIALHRLGVQSVPHGIRHGHNWVHPAAR